MATMQTGVYGYTVKSLNKIQILTYHWQSVSYRTRVGKFSDPCSVNVLYLVLQ